MLKYLYYIILALLIPSSLFGQDVIVDIQQWNINGDLNNSFVEDASITNSTYSLGSSLTWLNYGNGGALWEGVTTNNSEIDSNGNIKISFTVNTGSLVELTDIVYSVANNFNFATYRVNKYQLDYQINSDPIVNLLEVVDISGTQALGPWDNQSISLSSPIILNENDVFTLIWSPFDADQDPIFSLVGFYIKNNSVRLKGIARAYSTISPISDFTFISGCASAGTLDWTNPVDMTNKQVLVFAKKTSYIDQGSPSQDPSLYGTPITDLSQMTVSVPLAVQYENDAAAMLVYRGTGNSVDLTNFDNGIDYQFAAFVVDATNAPTYAYSNAQLTSGFSPNTLNEIVSYTALSKPTAADLTFVQPNCFDKIVIVANAGNAITTAPSGANTFTASPVWGDMAASTYLGGQVMYNGVGTGVNLTSLVNDQPYGISIWIEKAGLWSSGTFFSVTPAEYEVIITQEKCVDEDVIEFLTLTEIDFSTANYNLGNYAVCEDGLQYTLSDGEVGDSYFDNIVLDGASGIIPAGTYIRVYSNAGPGADELESRDGLVNLTMSGLALRSSNGDQAMLYIGPASGGTNATCGAPGTVNVFKSAINFGNNGWLSPGSGSNPSFNDSYAPPSVSNLAQPSVIPDLYPNYSLKDQYSISGSVAEIHSEISQTSNSSIWFANNDASNTIVKLKDIQFEATNFVSETGTPWLSSAATGELDIDLTQLTFADETDVRYMVVVHAVFQGDTPVDRYTCYDNITSDYSDINSPKVVTSVSGQSSSGDPCGTATVEGFGQVMYCDRDKSSNINITGLPCGTRVFVDVYAIKGNGYTMNLGTPASGDVLLDISAPVDYYSQGSGNIGDALLWDQVPGGGSEVTLSDFSSCINLIVQNGHTITFDPSDTEIGSLTIESGATVEVSGSNILTIERDFTIDGTFTANTSTVNLDGKYGDKAGFGAQTISGTATELSFYILRVNNTSDDATVTDNDVNFNIDADVTYGMRIDAGDLIIQGGKMITLVSTTPDYAAFFGEMNATSTITGDINAQRFLPLIVGVGPADAPTYGTGWRYLGVPVQNANFNQIADDFYTAGYIGCSSPGQDGFLDENGYYYPTIKKYDETVVGGITEGFDNDYDQVLGAPEIRVRRDASTSSTDLNPGEGVLAYLSTEPIYTLNNGIFDAVGTPNYGDIDVFLSYTSSGTGTDDGWHMVANPYPCTVDWKLVNTTGSGFNDGTIYIKNTEAGAVPEYVELNKASAIPQRIASHQAFWIKTNNNSITVQFREEDKVENPSANFYKNNDEMYQESLFVLIDNDTDTLLRDRAIVWFIDESSFDFDNAYDSYKLRSERVGTPILSSNIDGFDKKVSTNAIPMLEEDHEITFNLEIREAGNYTLSFEEYGYILEGSCVTMTDLVNDSTFIVDESTVYSFYSDLRASDAEPLFSMNISPSVEIESFDASCYEGNNGIASATGIGDGPFTYTWLDASGDVIIEEETSGTSTINELGQGLYSVLIDGNSTVCGATSNEIFIAQPTPFVNSTLKLDPTSCAFSDGSIQVTLDERATWTITWTNIETGQSNSVSGQNSYYSINNLSPGTYEVITSTDCGSPIIFEETLTDNNDVVASFTLPTDTIWLVDGGEALFLNTSENSSNWYWMYGDNSLLPDSSFDGSFTYTEPGVYGVTLVAQNGNSCSDIITQEIVVMADPSSVDDLSSQIVRSYISYGNGNPQYVIELLEDKEVQVQMINNIGQVMSTQNINLNGKTYVDLPTYDLSSGIYLIITLDDGTRIDTKKLFVR